MESDWSQNYGYDLLVINISKSPTQRIMGSFLPVFHYPVNQKTVEYVLSYLKFFYFSPSIYKGSCGTKCMDDIHIISERFELGSDDL